jgi:iron complex transport system substrate-binding protein
VSDTRIISLLPAGTDIVAALGAASCLVGITHECDHPDAVGRAARVTSSSIPVAAAAGVVDDAVRERYDAGEPLFTLHETEIAALQPDVIITQALCDVCAVSEHDVRALAGRLAPTPRIVTLGGTTITGILDDVRRVGTAIGLDAAAEALVEALVGRMRRVHETLKAAQAPRPRVAVIEWTDPVYAAGHWVPEMIRRAGGVDVLALDGEHSRQRRVEEIRDANPEIVLIAPCGYDAARAFDEGRALLASPDWQWAARLPVWAIDGNAVVSRPGPRVVDGVELFAALFNPQLFPAWDAQLARPMTSA